MKVSIIIPAYNVAKWIDDCICSCINQDMVLGQEYEIIVINDGSLDDTLAHLNKYEDKIIVISQTNGGVSAARNNGLKHAKGEYIWFIDGDDYIEPNVLGGLYKYAESQNLDILNFSFNHVPDKTVYSESIKMHSEKEFKPVLGDIAEQMVAANSFSRLEYIKSHNIFFKLGMRYGEDTMWAFRMLLYDPKVKKIFNKIYNYRVRQGSSLHTKSPKAYQYWLDSMIMMLEIYNDLLDGDLENLSNKKIENIKQRRNWSIQNVLFGALRLGENKRFEILAYLESNKQYPYPILWNKISFKYGFKNFIVNLISLFFPIKSYYLFLGKVYDTLKNRW